MTCRQPARTEVTPSTMQDTVTNVAIPRRQRGGSWRSRLRFVTMPSRSFWQPRRHSARHDRKLFTVFCDRIGHHPALVDRVRILPSTRTVTVPCETDNLSATILGDRGPEVREDCLGSINRSDSCSG
jgi:hypothetical protein